MTGPIVAAALAIGGPATAAAQATTVPLVVHAAAANPAGGTVTFTLQNSGSQTVTAWKVTIAARGDRTSTSDYGVDAWKGVTGLTSGPRGFITPGGAITVTAPFRHEARDVTVTPLYAILEDRSVAGEPMGAARVLQRRSAERVAWTAIVAALEAASNAPRGISETALQAALTHVDAIQVHDTARGVLRMVRTNLSLALDEVRSGRSSAQEKLTQALAQARRSLAALAAHSH